MATIKNIIFSFSFFSMAQASQDVRSYFTNHRGKSFRDAAQLKSLKDSQVLLQPQIPLDHRWADDVTVSPTSYNSEEEDAIRAKNNRSLWPTRYTACVYPSEASVLPLKIMAVEPVRLLPVPETIIFDNDNAESRKCVNSRLRSDFCRILAYVNNADRDFLIFGNKDKVQNGAKNDVLLFSQEQKLKENKISHVDVTFSDRTRLVIWSSSDNNSWIVLKQQLLPNAV
jgi:hypothetical protein